MKQVMYDGSLNGFLTSVFAIYELGEFDTKIVSSEAQTLLIGEVIEVKTDEEKARRVKNGIIKKASKNIFNEVATTFASGNKDKENIIFEYLKLVFAFGHKARLMLNNENVIKYNDLLKKVTYERHRMIGFLRFEETEAGILYAKYSPDHDITNLLLGHFANRLSTENFIIHDTKRNTLGVYNKETNQFFTYTDNTPLSPITLSQSESFFQKLWQNYHVNASIASRENRRLQRQFMPARYHKNMSELKRPFTV